MVEYAIYRGWLGDYGRDWYGFGEFVVLGRLGFGNLARFIDWNGTPILANEARSGAANADRAEAPLFCGGGGVRGGSEIKIKIRINGGQTNASVPTWAQAKATSKASDRSVRPTRASDPHWQTAAG